MLKDGPGRVKVPPPPAGVEARCGSKVLTQQGGRLRTFVQLLWWLSLLLGALLGPGLQRLLALLRLHMGGDRTVSEPAGMVVGLLVLHEGEANVQRADVEDDGDGDVEEAEQHHQLAGPVEEVEVDG